MIYKLKITTLFSKHASYKDSLVKIINSWQKSFDYQTLKEISRPLKRLY